MKVICISKTAKSHPKKVGKFMVEEGITYTVNGEFDSNEEHWYQLKEDFSGNGWNSIYFIPLSDFDEKLMACLRTKPMKKKVPTPTKNLPQIELLYTQVMHHPERSTLHTRYLIRMNHS